jgi:LysR family hydrogen peroxide-inducible transcriptional activator
MSRPTLRQLEYLVAVADHEHVGRAAAACHVSQPSLSAQLKELERQLGTAVTERVGRGITMTAAGSELADRARGIVRDTDDLMEAANRSTTNFIAALRLAAIPTVAPYLLPRVLPALRRHHPDAEVHLRELQTPKLTEALAIGEIDLGIMALPVDNPDFDHMVILDDPFMVAVAPMHQLAAAEEVALDQLKGEPVLLLEDGHCLRDQALDICNQVGAADHGQIQGTSLATLCQMVAAGMGVTLLPQSAHAVEAREGTGLVVRPFRGSSPSRHLVLVWRRRAPAAPLYAALAEIMRTELAD